MRTGYKYDHFAANRTSLLSRIVDLIDVRTVKNLCWVVFGTNYRQLLIFLINLYLAKVLDDKFFGLITFGYAVMLVFNGLGDFGIRSIAWRELSRVQDSPKLFKKKTALYLSVRIMTQSLACILFILFIFILNKSSADKLILVLFATGIFFNTMTFDWPFTARDKMHVPAISNIIFSSILLVSVVILISDSSQVFFFPLLFTLSNFIAFLYLFYLHTSNYAVPRLKVDFGEYKNVLKQASAIGINALVIRLYTWFPLIFLGLFQSDRMVGIFRKSHLIYAFISSFSLLVSSSIFSRVSIAFMKNDLQSISKLLRGVIVIALIPITLVSLCIFVFSESIIPILYSEYISNNTRILQILMLAIPLAVLNSLLKELLTPLNQQNMMLVLNLCSLFFLCLIIFPVNHYYGIIGLAISIVATEVFGLVMTSLYYIKYYRAVYHSGSRST